MSAWSLSGFSLRTGTLRDRSLLLQFMQQAHREAHPQAPIQHLRPTVDQYWSSGTPVWFVRVSGHPGANHQSDVACLWLGRAIDQVNGKRYTHIFLLFVCPDYRRQGIGRALMQQAEDWAQTQGDRQIGLQVWPESVAARELYAQLGYQTQALSLLKSLARS